MYFGQIRPEMIEIKVFRKITILTPLNLGRQNFLLDWIARVKVPPCAKLGVSSSKGVGARGHNAEKRKRALRAQF